MSAGLESGDGAGSQVLSSNPRGQLLVHGRQFLQVLDGLRREGQHVPQLLRGHTLVLRQPPHVVTARFDSVKQNSYRGEFLQTPVLQTGCDTASPSSLLHPVPTLNHLYILLKKSGLEKLVEIESEFENSWGGTADDHLPTRTQLEMSFNEANSSS